jgi:hypothetical protein
MSLADLVRAQAQLLDEMFGNGDYGIDASEEDLVRIRTEWMELSLVYDLRDQWVCSSVKPLRVPDTMSEDEPIDTLLRFLNIDADVRRKSALDEQQVVDELIRAGPLARLLKDGSRSRDAINFVSGYSAAYTDYHSGKWSSG